MSVNINFKRRIVVNGREFASVEEMPQDLRLAYEAALAKVGGNAIGMASSAGIPLQWPRVRARSGSTSGASARTQQSVNM